MDEVVDNIRACLLSSKGGISLNRVNKDYYDIVGENIPYRKYNFGTLEELISVVPGIRKFQKQNEYWIEAIPSSRTSHLAELVRGQKGPKRSKKMSAYNKPIRTPYSSNQDYQRNQVSYGSKSSSVKTKCTSSFNARYPSQPTTHSSTQSNNKNLSQVNNRSTNATNVRNSTFMNNKSSRLNGKSPTSTNNSFMYPPSAGTNVIPLTDEPVKPPQKVDKTNYMKTVNENPRNIPTMKMVDKNLRRTATAGSGQKPKSVQNRLRINVPKAAESEFLEKPKTVLTTPILPTKPSMTKRPKEDIKSYPISVNSIIPFDEFIEKTPEDELSRLAATLHMSSPVYKILPAKKGNVYAQVIVGNAKYSSYPEDAKSHSAAQIIAAKKALSDLKEKNRAILLPITQSDGILKQRLLKIVDSHPSGVFTSQLVKYYREEFKELLPENWIKVIKDCSEISIEEGANDTSILTRYNPDLKKVEETPPASPFGKMHLSSLGHPYPGVLLLPNDRYWITYVTEVFNTTEIWVRLVGEEYSDEFDAMAKSMRDFYNKNLQSTKAKVIELGGYYVVYIDDSWHRVKCVDFDPDTLEATVFFIDHGDDETFSAVKLHNLDKQFCSLPAQAIRLSLNDLEEFSECNEAKTIMSKYLLDRTLYVEVQESDSDEEDDTSVIFYDTQGPDDVNLNKLMSIDIVKLITTEPKLETQGRVTEVFVSHVSESGDIYVQLKRVEMKYLADITNKIVHNDLTKDLSHLSVTKVNLLKFYLVRSLEDNNWYRVQVLSNANYTADEVDVFLLDFGKTIRVKLSSLVDLESISEVLAAFPPQAVKVQLHNIPTSFFNKEKVSRLAELAPPNQPLLIKVVQSTTNGCPPIVELFKRNQTSNEIIAINNTLLFESELTRTIDGDSNNNVKTRKRSERVTCRYGSADRDERTTSLRPPEIPSIGNYFDVHVTMVSNPGNFVVQSFKDRPQLVTMMDKLQKDCKAYKGPPMTLELVREGNLYAAYHENYSHWYRVLVMNKFDQQTVTVYFCDYGDIILVPLKRLQPLHGQFSELPYQAIRAKLADVKPVNMDWSVEDCLYFRELVVEKDLVSVVKEISLNQSSVDTVLSLTLIDVSGPDDIFIDNVLIQEGRARV